MDVIDKIEEKKITKDSLKEKLDIIKVQTFTDEDIKKAWIEGQYTSISAFYNDVKDKLSFGRQTLRTRLINLGLWNVTPITPKEPSTPPAVSGSRELYKLVFNDTIGKDVKGSRLPKGKEKWIFTDDELDLAGATTDPVLGGLEMSPNVEKWVRFGFMILTLFIPRIKAELSEARERKLARSTQEPKE